MSLFVRRGNMAPMYHKWLHRTIRNMLGLLLYDLNALQAGCSWNWLTFSSRYDVPVKNAVACWFQANLTNCITLHRDLRKTQTKSYSIEPCMLSRLYWLVLVWMLKSLVVSFSSSLHSRSIHARRMPGAFAIFSVHMQAGSSRWFDYRVGWSAGCRLVDSYQRQR